MMIDDGSTAVSLPEVAAAGGSARHRWPYARRRQAQGAPRPRRRLLHDRGRHQGRRAVQWRLVDEVITAALEARGTREGQGRRTRREIVAQGRQGRRQKLTALDRKFRADGWTTTMSARHRRIPASGDHHRACAGSRAARERRRNEKLGAKFWPSRDRARARRRDPASAQQRLRGRHDRLKDRRRSGARQAFDEFWRRTGTIGSRTKSATTGSAC